MAKASGGNAALLEQAKNQAEKITGAGHIKKPDSVKAFLASVDVRKRFEDMLGKKAPGFISSIINVTNGSNQLKVADPITVISAAAIAASLDLPVDPNLGFAYIVPYNCSEKLPGGKWTKKMKAQFQLGYKGYIQLAMRTGQYKTINATEVYEGEIKAFNRFTGELEFGEKTSDSVVGYLSYFKLINGFEKYFYMSKEDMDKHALRYSQSYAADCRKKPGEKKTSRWFEDFDLMAIKTVLKLLLSKYGILSIQMETALKSDQAVIKEDDEGNLMPEYEDNVFDAEAEVFEPEEEIENKVDEKPEEQKEADPELDFDEKSVGF